MVQSKHSVAPICSTVQGHLHQCNQRAQVEEGQKILELDGPAKHFYVLLQFSLQMFLEVNLIITFEDQPTLAPLLVSVVIFKEMLSPFSDLVLSKMAPRTQSGYEVCMLHSTIPYITYYKVNGIYNNCLLYNIAVV